MLKRIGVMLVLGIVSNPNIASHTFTTFSRSPYMYVCIRKVISHCISFVSTILLGSVKDPNLTFEKKSYWFWLASKPRDNQPTIFTFYHFEQILTRLKN